ncbi:hypothetical protein [Streptomyces noursei]|uniref:hypothetical protein n=1 Tax=Streptomyces noursei TaxID=1971 RepID=UPI00167A7B82|nr:hypothetical protein [Streptomyces noursei]MCZ1019829.1 hypothetical protein [Streptomyces noursei]GGX36357.1 hypothetical protein GCM10010341_67340 [Streptomyces noursei]
MKIFTRNNVRAMAVGGVLLAAMGSTVAYAGGSTKTELSNGMLYFEAHNGREIGQSSTKVYTGEKYVKSGGSTVSVQMKVDFAGGLYKDTVKTVKAGQTVNYSLSVPVSVASDCSAVGLLSANGTTYETPYIKQLC